MAGVEGMVSLVPGRIFEDMLEGYVPLDHAIFEMMQRHGFALACFSLVQAPMMNLPGLAGISPVPLRLPVAFSGLAQRLDLVAERAADTVRIGGTGWWHWQAGSSTDTLSPAIRLCEPAVVRGIGLHAPDHAGALKQGGTSCLVARIRTSDLSPATLMRLASGVGWPSVRLWQMPPDRGMIARTARETDTPIFDVDPAVERPALGHAREVLLGPARRPPSRGSH